MITLSGTVRGGQKKAYVIRAARAIEAIGSVDAVRLGVAIATPAMLLPSMSGRQGRMAG